MAIATEATLDEALAAQYAADLLHRAIVRAGEPVKASEAARLAGKEEVDLRLARVILSSNNVRFTASDRKWNLWSRYADPARATIRNIAEVISTYGEPIAVDELAREVAYIYGRSTEYYQEALPRILESNDDYFESVGGLYGLSKWLLTTDYDTEEDILFDNWLTAIDAARFGTGTKLSQTDVDAIVAFLDEAEAPVNNLVLQLLAWRTNPATFDAKRFFNALWKDGRAALLSNGTWLGPATQAKLAAFFPAIADREVDEYGDNLQAEVVQPLVISEEEAEQLVKTVLGSETSTHAARLLESVYEVTPGETTYEGDLQTLIDTLRADERVQWLGADRFLPKDAIPAYVFTVPEILHIPVHHYTDAEGNELDLLLEDDGFDGGLQRDALAPLAQDVLDEEPAYTPDGEAPATARCVLKLHHKDIGTFPLCQLPAGFFPIDAAIVQADLVLPSGQRVEIWVNNETRLVYGLLDWYLSLPVDSGAVFYLERQAADRFVLTYGEETEPAMFVSRNRVNELTDLGQRAETEELPTFDILREIMEHYRKGIEFITLLTETNIARRTPRRMIASLLSGYHCFFQRGGAWVYDAKKLSQGFDKSKRKYLRK